MANTYFQFKQFTIHQDQCAMKVSTEACILGAWVPDLKSTHILDIGTGTGLLSLMLAQRLDANIGAIELDSDAANQARKNVSESKWKDRIEVITNDVFAWAKVTDRKFDLIVSNPPFFSNNLQSEVKQNNVAKHDTSTFNKQNLASALKSLLTHEGRAYILYPEYESKQFKNEVEKIGLYHYDALVIRNQPNGPVFRVIALISKNQLSNKTEELNIREGQSHSHEFNSLLKDYYLKL